MNRDETAFYAHYVANREHRRLQIAKAVADDWDGRRHLYWPTSPGVGQSAEALAEARTR